MLIVTYCNVIPWSSGFFWSCFNTSTFGLQVVIKIKEKFLLVGATTSNSVKEPASAATKVFHLGAETTLTQFPDHKFCQVVL